MKKSVIILAFIGLAFLFSVISYKSSSDIKEPVQSEAIEPVPLPNDVPDFGLIPFDSTLIKPFFLKHPDLKKYRTDLEKLYRKHQYNYIWYEKNRINEAGNLLYNKINNIQEEGILIPVPYIDQLNPIFRTTGADQNPNADTELLISAMYFFYADKVYYGLEDKRRIEMGWYLPRKKLSYVNYLDSLLTNPSLLHKDEKEVFGQYYRLREMLKTYSEMGKKGEWNTIIFDKKLKSFKPGDSALAIAQIRRRLYLSGDMPYDSGSGRYDLDLISAMLKFKKQNDFALDSLILPKHILVMNVPLRERIKTIMVNMERCRWMCSCITEEDQLIVINIPSYRLFYFRDGKKELTSEVVVGKVMNKTVVFNADMKYIVFSPYWNVPSSILRKEIMPAIGRNPNYLAQHDMEWYDGKVRQRPGAKNALGRIKFLFPNNNAIYLHDTPSKHLFKEEKRAFSHGCIRVAKPVELANLILQNDKNWTPQKIDYAMNREVESWYTLKFKIPVYIGYFTAWVNDEGNIHFYDDVYKRDAPLASLLFIK